MSSIELEIKKKNDTRKTIYLFIFLFIIKVSTIKVINLSFNLTCVY